MLCEQLLVLASNSSLLNTSGEAPVAWDDYTRFQGSFMQELSFLIREEVPYQVIRRWKFLDDVVAFKIYIYLQLMENIWWCGTVQLIFKAVSTVFYKAVTISWGGPFHYPQDYVTWLKECREIRFGLETTEVISAYWQIFGLTIRLNGLRTNLYLQQKPEGVHAEEDINSFLLPVWWFAQTVPGQFLKLSA